MIKNFFISLILISSLNAGVVKYICPIKKVKYNGEIVTNLDLPSLPTFAFLLVNDDILIDADGLVMKKTEETSSETFYFSEDLQFIFEFTHKEKGFSKLVNTQENLILDVDCFRE